MTPKIESLLVQFIGRGRYWEVYISKGGLDRDELTGFLRSHPPKDVENKIDAPWTVIFPNKIMYNTNKSIGKPGFKSYMHILV